MSVIVSVAGAAGVPEGTQWKVEHWNQVTQPGRITLRARTGLQVIDLTGWTVTMWAEELLATAALTPATRTTPGGLALSSLAPLDLARVPVSVTVTYKSGLIEFTRPATTQDRPEYGSATWPVVFLWLNLLDSAGFLLQLPFGVLFIVGTPGS